MTNSAAIVKFLSGTDKGAYCDDCLARRLQIEPRQQISQICNRLASAGRLYRGDTVCGGCGLRKLGNSVEPLQPSVGLSSGRAIITGLPGADTPGGFVTASKTPLEEIARDFFASQGISLQRQFVLKVGVSSLKKSHRFDLGCDEQNVLVECKDHTFTGSGNVPSAKLTIWNEAMYYFHISPVDYRKVFFVGSHDRGGETLAEYYVKQYGHLIPDGVEIWQHDRRTGQTARVYPLGGQGV